MAKGGGGRLAFYAIAGLVVIGLGLAVLWKRGYIGSVTPASANQGSQYESKVANFLREQHDMAVRDKAHTSPKFTAKAWEDSVLVAKECCGQQLQLADPAGAGLKFAGAGECAVPGQKNGRSAHYRFESADGGTVSLWIHRYNGDPEIPEGTTHLIGMGGKDPAVYSWRKGGIVYYLVTPAGVSADPYRQLWGAPANTEQGGLG